MKKNFLIQSAFLILFICLFISCSNKNRFTVEGAIKEGGGKMLYLENVTTSSVVVLDSVKLGANGSYKFKRERPETPDFYRLRLNQQFINFVVDSTETLRINSDTLHFAKNYSVEGSFESENVKTLTFLQLKTHEAYNKLQKEYRSQNITADEYTEKANTIIEEYKNEAKSYIYPNPASASAYFALFQQINGLLIFDPYDKTDSKAYGAVANNWNQRYPDAPRTKHLVRLFTNALAILRGEQSYDWNANAVNGKDFFDIALTALDNKEVRLSEIGKGKVVLVDFTAYGMKESPFHNRKLAEVYEKYRNQGFQIYQIALDADLHFWKNAAINLPWICVIDPQSVNSEIAKKYNVSTIPTTFIMDKAGEIVARLENLDHLEKEISNYMK